LRAQAATWQRDHFRGRHPSPHVPRSHELCTPSGRATRRRRET
jgi:hypothetical protein